MFWGSTGRRDGVREVLGWLTGGINVEFALMGGGFIPPSGIKGKPKFCARCWSATRLLSLGTCALSAIRRTMVARRFSPPD